METPAPNDVTQKPALTLLSQLATSMALRPGAKTTEFYVVLLVVAGLLALSFADKLPPEFASVVIAIAAAVFQWSRNYAKGAHADATTNLIQMLLDAAPLSEIPTPAQEPVANGAPSSATPAANVAPAAVPPGGGSGVGPVAAVICLLSSVLFLSGCATTSVSNAAGKVLLKTQADAASISFNYSSGGEVIALTIGGLNHSGPTLAGGHAFATGTSAVGLAGAGLLANLSTSGSVLPALPSIASAATVFKPTPQPAHPAK